MRTITTLLLLAISSPILAAPVMQPGLWQITTEITLPGVQAKIPPVTSQQCFTASQLKATEHPLPAMKGCTIKDSTRDGEITRWNMQCNSEGGSMQATGEIRYGPDSYQGMARFTDSAQGKHETVIHRYSAKRIGACP